MKTIKAFFNIATVQVVARRNEIRGNEKARAIKCEHPLVLSIKISMVTNIQINITKKNRCVKEIDYY